MPPAIRNPPASAVGRMSRSPGPHPEGRHSQRGPLMPGLPLRSLPDLVLELRRGESMTISIVRPTSSLALLGTALYLAVTMRRAPWQFLATAGAWLGLFAIYSWRHFHHL